MRDNHHMHIMKTNLLLDMTLNPLCYIYFSCDQHWGNFYLGKIHPPKTLNEPCFHTLIGQES